MPQFLLRPDPARNASKYWIKSYIKDKGKAQYPLPFGAIVYSIHKMSTVVDDDCMDSKSEEVNDILKYLILREDGHLYTDWGDEGTLIF